MLWFFLFEGNDSAVNFNGAQGHLHYLLLRWRKSQPQKNKDEFKEAEVEVTEEFVCLQPGV
jgi:hypothetical protein